jgi:RNA polymerase sigma factor (sigma-70 family)
LSNDLSTSPIVDERLLQEEVLSVVCQVLTEMRQTDRETAGMLKAALFDGADQKEIAKLYAVSISTVKRRIKDARDKIRERLGLE